LSPSLAERDLPVGVVDIKVEVGIAIEEAGNRLVQGKVFQTIEETRVWVELEMPDGVAIQIVIPGEQIFGVGVEIERIGITVVLSLASILELHGKPRLARTVVGVEQDEVRGLRRVVQIVAQPGY